MIIFLIIAFILIFVYIWGYIICLISSFKKDKKEKILINKDFSFTCLICAHNEEKTINKTIEDLLKQDYKNKDIYVILDNCTDNTENIVNKYKVNKIIKNTKSTCKGDALNYSYDYLTKNNKLNDVIVIFDADSNIDKDFLTKLNNKYKTGSQVVMTNTDSSNPYDNVITNWYLFYWKMVSVLSRESHSKLNLSSNISGSGISFKKEHIIKTKTITEDTELFFIYSKNNIKIDYVNTSTYQEQPTTFKQLFNQLYRWNNGDIKINKLFKKDYLKSLIKDFNLTKLDAYFTSQNCGTLGRLVLIFVIMLIISIFYNKLFKYLLILFLIYIILTTITAILITIKSKLKISKVYKGILTYFLFLIILGLIYDYALIKPSDEWIKIERK